MEIPVGMEVNCPLHRQYRPSPRPPRRCSLQVVLGVGVRVRVGLGRDKGMGIELEKAEGNTTHR